MPGPAWASGEGHREEPLSQRLIWVVGAALLLGLLAWQGHHLAHWLPQLEQWIASLGPWGPVVLFFVVLLFGPLLVPDTLFGVAAGVAFGLFLGFVYYFVAVYVTCLLVYFIARCWLRRPVLRALATRSRLERMAMAARRQATLTLWIRLVPINPNVVSYALGAVDVPFRPFALGTFGMLPHMFLTVYLGVAAAHVTRMAGGGHAHWKIEGVGLLLGLAACAVLTIQVTRRASATIDAAERELEARSG